METPKPSRYVDMPVPDIVKALCDDAQPDSKLHQEIKGALLAVLTRDLIASIDRHERAASRLARVILWLDITLGAFTMAGAIFGLIALLH